MGIFTSKKPHYEKIKKDIGGTFEMAAMADGVVAVQKKEGIDVYFNPNLYDNKNFDINWERTPPKLHDKNLVLISDDIIPEVKNFDQTLKAIKQILNPFNKKSQWYDKPLPI